MTPRTTHARRTRRWLPGLVLAGLAVGSALELPGSEELALLLVPGYPDTVEAQYGTSRRVARRTSRRTSRRRDYMYPDVAVGVGVGVGVGAGYVTTLPAGCVGTVVGGISYQRCGSVYYRPYYQGETLVYAVETP